MTKTTFVLFLPLLFGMIKGECEGLGELFPLRCDFPELNYNQFTFYHSGDNLYVADAGRIYRGPEMCGTIMLDFIVPGTPNLNDVINSIIPSYNIVFGDQGTIVRSSPTSPSWTLINSPTTQDLNKACSHPVDIGIEYIFAVGDSGTVLRSADFGLSWFSLPSPTSANLHQIDCFPDNHFQVYGDSLTGYKSTDGGMTWIQFQFYGAQAPNPPTSGPPDLYSSFFFNPDTGYVFGEFGVTFFTSDGGTTWRTGLVPGFDRINTAFFMHPDSGGVAGDNGTIRFTTDGGLSWFEDSVASSLTSYNINSINVSDSLAVIVGDSGTVIFVARDSTLLSSDNVDATLPQDFQLLQNYPNPFNPSTRIEFSLPQTSHTTLKVYNKLGEEVATLVSEELPVGIHTTQWNATAVASGVYFYRLQAGDFVDTKKLLLLR